MTKAAEYELDEDNIFAAIGRKDADEFVARSELLDEVGDLIEKSGLTQHEVAKKLGIKQSKVSMLVNGHLSEFSGDILLHYLAILGFRLILKKISWIRVNCVKDAENRMKKTKKTFRIKS